MHLDPGEQESLDRMANADLIVGFAYGNCGSKGALWSVTVLDRRTMSEFEKPFAAVGFSHALEIAVLECELRGWIKRT